MGQQVSYSVTSYAIEKETQKTTNMNTNALQKYHFGVLEYWSEMESELSVETTISFYEEL